MVAINDIKLAVSLLTRLPVRLPESAYTRSAEAAWAYPLVGGLTGALSAVAASLALWAGLPAVVAAIFALAAGIIVTGAMHEDGLADCADGFWGGWDREMRLKIMKDSQIGTYGVLALVLGAALRVSALTVLMGSGSALLALIAVHVASRAVMPAMMSSLPNAREGGLSSQVGRVSAQNATIAAAFGCVMLIVWLGIAAGLFAAALVLAALYGWRAVARAKISGQTGDVIGASQQIAEVTILLGAAAFVTA